MTISQDVRIRSLREALQALAAVVTILVAGAGVIVWVTGGFRPETQVQVSGLSEQVSQLRAAITDLTRKVDQMPRAADYTTQDSHLTRIDTQLGTLTDRVTRDEIEASGLKQQVQQYLPSTGTPVRNPR